MLTQMLVRVFMVVVVVVVLASLCLLSLKEH